MKLNQISRCQRNILLNEILCSTSIHSVCKKTKEEVRDAIFSYSLTQSLSYFYLTGYKQCSMPLFFECLKARHQVSTRINRTGLSKTLKNEKLNQAFQDCCMMLDQHCQILLIGLYLYNYQDVFQRYHYIILLISQIWFEMQSREVYCKLVDFHFSPCNSVDFELSVSMVL